MMRFEAYTLAPSLQPRVVSSRDRGLNTIGYHVAATVSLVLAVAQHASRQEGLNRG